MGKFDPIRDLQDLTGRVAIVTGATSGIGFATAQQLLRKGATVYLAARNEEKAKDVIARLNAEGLEPGSGKPIFHELVLDDPRRAKASAETFLQKEERLDILINNAATFLTPYSVGALGCDNDIIINQVSPFVFTNALLPLMKKTALIQGADVRIIIVASNAHAVVNNVHFSSREDLVISYAGEKFEAMKRYGRTKLANILWARELARRLALSTEDGGANIIVVTLHPGGVASEGLKANFPNIMPKVLSRITMAFMLTPTEGAYNSTFAAASPKVRRESAKYHGAYLCPGQRICKPSKLALDEQLAKDLWDLQERILKEEGI